MKYVEKIKQLARQHRTVTYVVVFGGFVVSLSLVMAQLSPDNQFKITIATMLFFIGVSLIND